MSFTNYQKPENTKRFGKSYEKESTQWKKLEIHRDETQVVNKHVKIVDVNGSQGNTKLNPVLSKIKAPKDVPRNCECISLQYKEELRLKMQLSLLIN